MFDLFPLCTSAYKQKDTEGKDRTVFDIPIFTEEFLNHSKGEDLQHPPHFVLYIPLPLGCINVVLGLLCRSKHPRIVSQTSVMPDNLRELTEQIKK